MLRDAINRKYAVLFLSIAALGCICISEASAAVQVPSSTGPGLVEKRLTKTPKAAPKVDLNVPAGEDQQKEVPEKERAQLSSQKFPLKKVVFDGATVYTNAELEPLYQDKIGKTVSLLDAKIIANQVTAFYRNNGYILSQAIVPPQDVTKGTLKIRVVEGFISKVTYQGDVEAEGIREHLDKYSASIKAQRPTNLNELERYMLIMNDLPGSTVTGLIHPSASQFAGADLVLTVRNKKYEGSYTFDNRGTQYIGPFQHTLMAGVNSMINTYDHTQVRFMTVNPMRELFLAEVQHDEMLDNEGTKLTVLASHTQTRPGDTLKNLRIEGNSDLFELKISHPFERTRKQSFVVRGIVDVRNTYVDVYSGTSLNRDRLRVVRAGGTYGFLDVLRGSNSFDAMLSEGFNIFDATDTGSDRSNAIGSSNFTKINVDLSRLQPLKGGFSLFVGATGQYSFNPLLTDEQFTLGGADYGRSFDPAQVMGDSGIAGKAEIRYDEFVSELYFESYQLFGYADVGEAWTRGAANSDLSMASAGVGSRFKFTENFYGTLEAAFPLMWPKPDTTDYRSNPRVFFSLTAKY
ncbi:MAG: POTRA domain-containing protein [Bdellovibrionales bacterium]